jgi:uncharacterized protein YqjF (DUF2071 family)
MNAIPTPVVPNAATAAKPVPEGWKLFMHWNNLLFASWRVSKSVIQPLLPKELEVDTFDGSAWVTLVPLGVDVMNWKDLPPLPGMDRLTELNLRTYTTRDGQPGVYFLSIDCPCIIPDMIGRHFFGVPFFQAQFAYHNDLTTYNIGVQRTEDNQQDAAFFGDFKPSGPSFTPKPGSLENFLVERLCLYYVAGEKVHRVNIFHQEWRLQEALTNIGVNTTLKAAGLPSVLALKPDHAIFCDGVDTHVWLPKTIGGATGEVPSGADTAKFHLVSVWTIDSPLPLVWDAMFHFENWPSWWKGVLNVEVLERGDAHRIGFRTRQTFESALPYKLIFEAVVERVLPLSLIQVKSTGDLKGTGLLQFAEKNGKTIFQLNWDVSPTSLWMRLLTPILGPAFTWNHRVLMDRGAQGLAQKLNIPTITTSPLDVLAVAEVERAPAMRQ